MKKSLSYLESFLEIIWKKKTWIITSSLFLFSVNYAFISWWTLPDAYRANYRSANWNQFEISQTQFVSQGFERLQGFMEDLGDLLDLYSKHFTGKEFNDKPSAEIIETAHIGCILLRRDLAKHIGFFILQCLLINGIAALLCDSQ